VEIQKRLKELEALRSCCEGTKPVLSYEKLGRGASGIVYKAKDTNGNFFGIENGKGWVGN
jgi:hypothetical protein